MRYKLFKPEAFRNVYLLTFPICTVAVTNYHTLHPHHISSSDTFFSIPLSNMRLGTKPNGKKDENRTRYSNYCLGQGKVKEKSSIDGKSSMAGKTFLPLLRTTILGILLPWERAVCFTYTVASSKKMLRVNVKVINTSSPFHTVLEGKHSKKHWIKYIRCLLHDDIIHQNLILNFLTSCPRLYIKISLALLLLKGRRRGDSRIPRIKEISNHMKKVIEE